jgi:hypothetical protein
MKEELITEKDLKLNGKQLFEARSNIIETLKIDGDEDEEFSDEEGEGNDDDDDDGDDAPCYDKTLYEADLEEEVDFE